jgi:AcrR family transcriptional regulator
VTSVVSIAPVSASEQSFSDLPIRAPGFAETHERIIEARYGLFCRRAVRDVAMDEVVVASGVAKATLCRNFPTKVDLVLAFLARREVSWTFGIVEGGAHSRPADPEERLLAIFDVFDDWFQRDDFEACSFVNVLLEMGPTARSGAPTPIILPTSAALSVRSRPRPGSAIPMNSRGSGTSRRRDASCRQPKATFSRPGGRASSANCSSRRTVP